MLYRFPAALLLLVLVTPTPARAGQRQAQPTASAPAAPMSVADATALTNGWARLAEGRAADAFARAMEVLGRRPRDPAAMALAVDAEIARGGAQAALTVYARLIGQQGMEEPAMLGRVAEATLREAAGQRQDPAARMEALRGLAAAGDNAAATELASVAYKNVGAETRVLASMGDPRAVSLLITDLGTPAGNRVTTIDALGESGSRRAVPALLERLTDQRVEVRGAALHALGNLGDAAVAPRIKPLLADPSSYVRIRAAGALFKLGDNSGLQILSDLAQDQSSSSRLAAAEAMASRPDSAWLALVNDLTTAPEPEVRAAAARLLASQDPQRALAVIDPLLSDPNAAIRDLASRQLTEGAVSDLPALRGLMAHPDRVTRVRAAARVLLLTR